MNSTVTDVFDLLMFDDAESASNTEHISSDDALIDCLNRFGFVDMKYLSERTGLSVEQLAQELKNVIFQNPESVMENSSYDPSVGWMLSAQYLNGNAYKKLELAQRAEKAFPGHFRSNIEALRKILPPMLNISEIHISLGASWIPSWEYSNFIYEFLHLSAHPDVAFSKELCKWEVTLLDSGKTVLNTITYGVRANDGSRLTSHVKQYLTGVDLIEQTMNAKTVKVHDYVPVSNGRRGCFDYEPVFNKNKTIEAQDKQKRIIEGFKDWVYSDAERVERFERYYNDALVGYTFSAYDGAFLKLPGLNPDVTFYPHQKNAVARVLLSGKNVLLAHDVGTGKTYEMIASVHELKRLGMSEKNLIVVPNNVLKATVDMHKHLYPEDKILVVFPRAFTPATRQEILKQIRDQDQVAIYMAYSSFDMIVMSKEYYRDRYTAEIKRLNAAAYNADSSHEKSALTRKAENLSKRLHKYMSETPPCPWLNFDELGINTLVLDEAHNYKNIPLETGVDNIVGMRSNGSKKCREMQEKARNVDRLIFATGTPLTNSLADLFTFQLYLQPKTLELHKINTFDTWINTFGQRETSIECDVDANSASLRTVTRFSSFHNLGELMSLFAQVCDFHHIDQEKEGLPYFGGYRDVCVPKSAALAEYVDWLSERTDRIRNKEVKRTEDNLLKVTTDGRMAALDLRLVAFGDDLYESEQNKINACAQKVMEVYRAYPDSVQVVFSDIGTPKAGFNVYDCLKSRLIELGMLSCEIAFVHDATTETARAKLFRAMNQGDVRVVVGSTPKLGVGVNVQERLVALHHLSVPWRPADMVQREGRILRKGNTSEEVFIYRYITEGTFDAYSWQLLENKQKFISSFLSGTSAAREMEDIADAVLTYAEVKALAIGNPLIKQRVELSNQIERKKIASRARQRQMQELRTVVELNPERINELEERVRKSMKDRAHYRAEKLPVPNRERLAFGEELLSALEENVKRADERLFHEYQGFQIILPANMHEEYPHVLVRNANEYYCEMPPDKPPMGCSKTIDYLLEHLEEYEEQLREKIKQLYVEIREAQDDLDQDNPYLAEIRTLQTRLEELDRQLEESTKEECAS